MRSFFRFLIFVSVLVAGVAALYIWRTSPHVPQMGRQATLDLPNLAAIDREFTQLVGSLLPSVVSINAIPRDTVDPREKLLRQMLGARPGERQPPQLGSGAIVSKDGYIVTNLHVIQNAGAVEVQLNDGRVLPARFIGADRISDVAILKIDAVDLVPLTFGDSDEVNVGQTVFAVGNPFGLQETVTKGIISGKSRRTMSEERNEFFQTDAPINPGNSGGPLVDLKGRIIGINNWIILQTDGMGFAIPSNTVRRAFESIRDNGRFIRPWFGVSMTPLTPALAEYLKLGDSRGALVAMTMEGSPAARAGVQPKDLIVSYNGRPITDWIDFRNRISEAEPGKEVTLGIKRGGQDLTVQVTLEKQPGE